MYVHGVEPTLDTLTFRYIVPHTPSRLDEATPFQMHSPGLFETASAFNRISVLPRDAAELVADQTTLIGGRIAGRGLSVLPVPMELLETAISMLDDALVVVVSCSTEIAMAVASVLQELPHPILHVMADSPALSRSGLRDYCLAVASYWMDREGLRSHADALQNGLRDWVDPLDRHELGFRDWNHLLTLPNMRALEGVGYFAQRWNGVPLIGLNNEPYFAAIKESVTPIVKVRNALIEENAPIGALSRTDLILTVPGVLKHWRRSKDLPTFVKEHEKKTVRSVLRQIVARESYSFSTEVPEGTSHVEALSWPSVQSLLYANKVDLEVYTQMLAIRAGSSFAPVVRLPAGANGAFTELSQLAIATRAHRGNNFHKLNRLARNLSARLSKDVPGWIIDLVKHSDRIKLVSDVPLEWMSIDGFPLMLTADVSRIPVTPGNLFAQLMLRCTEMPIREVAFQDVLVVRSFKRDDPIRSLLEHSMQCYGREDAPFPRYRIVDVGTRSELVGALNEFRGAILIYDGHGVHAQATDVGELALVNERVNVWELRGEARIPPIVLLSACDTHPFDASHMTVGNGFLVAGAMTVLSTSVPVNGIESAAMIARLLYRVGAYLPLLIKQRPWRSFRWSEIVPGLQRRNYASDAIRRLTRLGVLKCREEVAVLALIDVGMAIDQGRDWLGLLIKRIADIAACSEAHAREQLRTQVSFAESLMYSQLGNPELIVGVGPETIDGKDD